MSHNKNLVFTDVVKDVIGNEPVVDQFDIDYTATFYGGMQDDVVTGSMLVKKSFFTIEERKTFLVTGTRGRSFSAWYANQTPLDQGFSSQDVKNVPWLAPRLEDPHDKSSRTAYRFRQCFDPRERYYDTCLPNLADCFKADNASVWTTYNDPNYFLSPHNNAVTSSTGYIFFNSIERDRTIQGLDYDPLTNNRWTWSYPYEARYNPTNRYIKPNDALGIVSTDIQALWESKPNIVPFGQVVKSSTSKKIDNFFSLLHGHLEPKDLAPGGRNSQKFYLLSGTTKFYPFSNSDAASDVFGYSYLIPSDVNLGAYGNEAAGDSTQLLTGTLQYDDKIKFLFGFGDLNNMSFSRISFDPTRGDVAYLQDFELTGSGPHLALSTTGTYSEWYNCYKPTDLGKYVLNWVSEEVISSSAGLLTDYAGTNYQITQSNWPNNNTPGSNFYWPDQTYSPLPWSFAIPQAGFQVPAGAAPDSTIGGNYSEWSDPAATPNYASLWSDSTSTNWFYVQSSYYADIIPSSWTSDLDWAPPDLSIVNAWVNPFYDESPPIFDWVDENIYVDLEVNWASGSVPDPFGKPSGGFFPSWRIMSRQGQFDASIAADYFQAVEYPYKLNHISGSNPIASGGIYWTSASNPVGPNSVLLNAGNNGAGSWTAPVGTTTPAPPGKPILNSFVLISDTDPLYGGTQYDYVNPFGGQGLPYYTQSITAVDITSSYEWSFSYDRAVACDRTDGLLVYFSSAPGVSKNASIPVEWLPGTGDVTANVTSSIGFMTSFDLLSSSSFAYANSLNSQLNFTKTTTTPPTRPMPPGKYRLNFAYIKSGSTFYPVTAQTGTLGRPDRAAIDNFKITQFRQKCYTMDPTSPTIGGNNYPEFRKTFIDDRVADKFGGSADSTPQRNNTRYTYQSYNFGVSPVIRGWKYGLYNGFPTTSKAVFRRDHYGHFRDMLEQRQYTKFVQSQAESFAEIAATSKNGLSYFDLVGKTASAQRSMNPTVGPSPVHVDFVKQRYSVDGKGVGHIYNEKVDPLLTTSQNLSTEVTSSIPYSDGEAKSRQEDSFETYKSYNITSVGVGVGGNFSL